MIDTLLSLDEEELKDGFIAYSELIDNLKHITDFEEDGDYYIEVKRWKEQDVNDCLYCIVKGFEEHLTLLEEDEDKNFDIMEGATIGAFNIIHVFFGMIEEDIDRYLLPYDVKDGLIACKMYIREDKEEQKNTMQVIDLNKR